MRLLKGKHMQNVLNINSAEAIYGFSVASGLKQYQWITLPATTSHRIEWNTAIQDILQVQDRGNSTIVYNQTYCSLSRPKILGGEKENPASAFKAQITVLHLLWLAPIHTYTRNPDLLWFSAAVWKSQHHQWASVTAQAPPFPTDLQTARVLQEDSLCGAGWTLMALCHDSTTTTCFKDLIQI